MNMSKKAEEVYPRYSFRKYRLAGFTASLSIFLILSVIFIVNVSTRDQAQLCEYFEFPGHGNESFSTRYCRPGFYEGIQEPLISIRRNGLKRNNCMKGIHLTKSDLNKLIDVLIEKKLFDVN